MSTPPGPGFRPVESYRFGAFEIRCRAGELTYKGMRVRIQDLPFRMLLVLLESPGEIVSREHLRDRLWGEKTFVDFDNNLRVAAAKLREALSDNAANPEYLETIARRGYRFVADVTPLYGATASLLPADLTKQVASSETGSSHHEVVSPVEIVPVQVSNEAAIKLPDENRRRFWGNLRRPRILVPACILLLLAATGLVWRASVRHRPLIASQENVVVGPIVNKTSDPVYDNAFSLPFRIKMEESPYLRLVPGEAFQRALHSRPSASVADELSVCRTLGAGLLLGGELLPEGERLKFRLTAFDCPSGRRLAFTEERASGADTALAALDKASEHMRLVLGEAPASIDRFNASLAKVTTNSLSALHAFHLGEEMHIDGREQEATTYFKMATDLDPQFALSYLQLGRSYSNLSEDSLSRAYYQKAYDLRERTTDRERLYIASSYYSYATGEVERAVAAYQLWGSIYPNDVIVPNNLANIYLLTGVPGKALANARRAIELEPSLELPYATFAQALLRNGDLRTLKLLCNDKKRSTTNALAFHLACYDAAEIQNDQTSAAKELTWASDGSARAAILNEKAEFDIQAGRLHSAREAFSAAASSATQSQLPEFAAEIDLNEALFLSELGFAKEARALTTQAVNLASFSTDVNLFAALVWAELGDQDHAHQAAEMASRQFPQGTLLHKAELPSVEALLNMHAGLFGKALEELETVKPYDQCQVLNLMPGYERGLSYLRTGENEKSIAELQNVLRYRITSPQSLFVPLAELRLAQSLIGSRRDAAPLIDDLESRWKDADPSFAPLADLRALQRKQVATNPMKTSAAGN
jgi:eukaryotic-like serine/threonine-protein kinase